MFMQASVLSRDKLIDAGIDSSLADDIVRRRSELELAKLELRDAAIRSGTLGTESYMDDLNALIGQETSLRDELGEDTYDRYLFGSGQVNRVRVDAVMTGSAAEGAGFREGDIVLSYNDDRVFKYTELQQATTEGERDEYVNVTVYRDGQQVLLYVPRGPLGIRLGAARADPDS